MCIKGGCGSVPRVHCKAAQTDDKHRQLIHIVDGDSME